jgi:membrane peptidoglycan carboxypeptidase
LKQRIAAGVGGFFGLLVLLFALGYLLTDLPPANPESVSEATVIRYADGGEIGRIGAQNRELVTLDEVPDPVQKAVLAAEDRGFYTEPGISPKGILRALFTNVKGGGGIQQGGSTITQQYAKNAYLTQNRTYTRKVKEVFIALKLSRKLSKDEILERYLNTIYFGRGASGIQVAARTYFNREAKDLTPAQGAVLAATIRSPAAYDPSRHPERAKDRFAYVLDGMVKKGWLTQEEAAAVKYPTVLKPGEGKAAQANDRKGPKGYVLDMVEEELARNGFPEDRLAQGGFVVQTTLRRKAQEAAVRAVEGEIPDGKGAQDQPVGALVSISPDNGEVWAYYGGRPGNASTDWAAGETRQPGSSFKPYVLATALNEGTGLGTRYDGRSPQEICGQEISNDEGDPPLGQTDLVKGLALSVNTVYFRLSCDVGPRKVAEMAHRAGISDNRKLAEDSGSVAAGIALGIYPVTVLDQATGYATFAGGGVHHETHFVKAVKQGKDTVYGAKPDREEAFDKDVAADATYAMQQVVRDGTGTRAKIDGRPTAGKTGTTNDNKDAWFCGFTPQLATAVWVGRPDRQPLRGVLGSDRGVYGGTVPAKIFKAYMEDALEGQPVRDFPPRANVGKNADTGGSSDFSPRPAQSTAPSSPSPLPSLPPVASFSPAPQPSEQPPPPSEPPPSQEPPPSPSPDAQQSQQPQAQTSPAA